MESLETLALPASPAQVVVSPGVTSVTAGGLQLFSAVVKDSGGNTLTDPVTWSIETGGLGCITSGGFFTAPVAGSATVRATSGNVSSTATITITPGSDLLRIAGTAYSDGISTPAWGTLPSARRISNAVENQPSDTTNNHSLTDMAYVWGQFIDHDLSLTPSDRTSPLNIAVPTGDPQFDPTGTGTRTIPFSRSAADPATGTSIANPRQLPNVVTPLLDGSMIYGSDSVRAASLRTFSGGQMKTSTGNLLPFNTSLLPMDNETHYVANDQLFLAGDVRANENIELTTLQTLFVREHNRLATSYASANPSWSDEQIFQAARHYVIAELQAITYNEYLPALLGTNAIPAYSGYNASVNPQVAVEFSTAAYRFGHSMVDNDIERLDDFGNPLPAGGVTLLAASFNPTLLHPSLPNQEGDIGPFLRGMTMGVSQEVDPLLVDGLRNQLFGPPGSGGIDLAAFDIQRGRDVGLPDYNSTRAAYGLPRVTRFADITSDVSVQNALASVYPDVDHIDLFVGGLAENHLSGSSLGPTFQAILVEQFNRTRAGDPGWYQTSYSGTTLAGLQATTLSKVIQRNTSLTSLQANVFLDVRSSFAAPTIYNIGTTNDPFFPNAAPQNIVSVDVNADGRLDLVVAHSSDSSVYILLGNGNGSFQSATRFAVGQAIRGEVFTADFNNDGKRDLFLSPSSTANPAIVMLGNGNGTFQPAITSSTFNVTGAYPRGWAVGDFNNDGKQDLTATLPGTSSNDGAVEVLLGNGNGTFQAAIVGPRVLGYSRWVTTGDFNNDGKLDLATADGQQLNGSPGNAQLSILLGNGNGTFRLGGHYASPGTPNADNLNPEDVVVGDVNKDGKLDAIISDYDANINLFLGNGDGTFQAAIGIEPREYPRGVVIRDVNGDSNPDLVITCVGVGVGGAEFASEGYQPGAVVVMLGDGTGHFQSATRYFPFSYPGWSALGDFNGDGAPDIATTRVFDGHSVSVMLNVPGGTNLPPTIEVDPTAAASPVTTNSVHLSVLGADDGGETNLTYTWGTVIAPPGAVSFSANGTNAAKNVTATFTKPGTYYFQVTITDATGLSAIAMVPVTVNATMTNIVVAPGTASVAPNATQQFTATAVDQFGIALATQPSFTWSINGGGTINASGLFQAGAVQGGPFTVTATSGAIRGNATLSVANVASLTVYSLAGDGRLAINGTGNSQSQWDLIHDATTVPNVDYTSANRNPWVGSLLGGGNIVNTRGYLAFDTSSIPANAVVTSVTLGVYVTAKSDSLDDGNDFISVVQGLQASPTSLVGSDYTKAGNAINNPKEGSNRVDLTGMAVNSYVLWSLNAAGLTWITPGGVTQLAMREGHDLLDLWPSYTGTQANQIGANLSETAGTAQDPYLQINYFVPTSPPAGTIQFTTSGLSVNENGGNAILSVSRTGGSFGNVSVSYATSNGSAVAPADYTSSTGTLTWAAGDTTTKTISIPIINDSLVESKESFNLALSSPTGGAVIGALGTIIVTINDTTVLPPPPPPPPPPSPPPTPTTNLRLGGESYLDINANGQKDGSEPGMSGRTVYLDMNNSGAFESYEPSRTTDANGTYVFDYMTAGNYLVREVRYGTTILTGTAAVGSLSVNLSAGIDQLAVNLGHRLMAPIFPTRATANLFTGNYADSNSAYVYNVFQSLLNHDPSPSELAYHVDALKRGYNRVDYATSIYNRDEQLNYQVDRLYQAVLKHPADAAGLAFWSDQLRRGLSPEWIISLLAAANEYQVTHASDAAYITGLYNDLLCRQPTSADVAFWTNYLRSHSRFDLAFNFATTPEAYSRAVHDVFTQFLHRDATPADVNNWVGMLVNRQVSVSRMAILLIASAEFGNKASYALG